MTSWDWIVWTYPSYSAAIVAKMIERGGYFDWRLVGIRWSKLR